MYRIGHDDEFLQFVSTVLLQKVFIILHSFSRWNY
jgi:hypothetical protein